MHKYVYHRSKLHPAIWTYCDQNKLIHQYNTRQKDGFHMYVVNIKSEKGSIKLKGSNLWSKLPIHITKSSHAHLSILCLKLFTTVVIKTEP